MARMLAKMTPPANLASEVADASDDEAYDPEPGPLPDMPYDDGDAGRCWRRSGREGKYQIKSVFFKTNMARALREESNARFCDHPISAADSA